MKDRSVPPICAKVDEAHPVAFGRNMPVLGNVASICTVLTGFLDPPDACGCRAGKACPLLAPCSCDARAWGVEGLRLELGQLSAQRYGTTTPSPIGWRAGLPHEAW